MNSAESFSMAPALTIEAAMNTYSVGGVESNGDGGDEIDEEDCIDVVQIQLLGGVVYLNDCTIAVVVCRCEET